jgi:hypothetical protein
MPRSSSSSRIDAQNYERQRDRPREELTLAQIDLHADSADELDVQGILAFAERVLRTPQTCGSRRRSTTSSDCRSGSSRKVAYDGKGSIEPP